MPTRTYDFVLFGGTGYTGGLTAEYLATHAPRTARWALAGRSRSKLAALRERLAAINPNAAAVELLEVKADDSAAMARLAESTKVVITTVGPYILHGFALVKACAEAGTHYCDLTGEPEFVDTVWLRHHAKAAQTGAKLVHCCGFDSIPHDLGAYFTVKQLPASGPIAVNGYVRAGGKFSAGTYHSALNAFARAKTYLKIAKERKAKEAKPEGRSVRSGKERVRFDRSLGTWVVPMPTIDPMIVRRSAVLLPEYGTSFQYGHYVQLKKLPQVIGLVAGVSALFAGAQFKLSRDFLLAQKASGEGPTEAERSKGWFRVRFVGEGSGQKVVVDVTGGDPGYGDTSKMLAESGLCLAFDALPARAGQLTPVGAMGDALLQRLQAAGMGFHVVSKS